ncbi:DUF3732 domain-containing protein [Snodgrassella alvi]|uniref:DUF3732 domain-containing protein n=1 Tax=Snodgrassella alvi TaxID=1196083 RepID=UPI000C1F4EC8|nr:DUF3732 domain-containing protein [Snodgrassella alvi]PIT15864.1 hypothetical protein BGI34_11745 [Snodgrassella alvi]PIT19015.1 hypothetical protein BGI33_00670 [Snodgrassella alvi]
MKFIIHEIKIWFNDETINSKSLNFLPNKINVITGLANTGKTTIWSIIDYCLLSENFNIATSISKVASWFGLRFSINGREISIVRQSPSDKRISSNIYFAYGGFPLIPENNINSINELKEELNEKFGFDNSIKSFFVTNSLNKSLKKEYQFDYRDFLIFCALTDTIIGIPNIYLDNIFYSNLGNIDKLTRIFDLAMGIHDLKTIEAYNQLYKIEKELSDLKKDKNLYTKNELKLTTEIKELFEKCKFYNFLSYDINFISTSDSIALIERIVQDKKDSAISSEKFKQLDKLRFKKRQIQLELNEIRNFNQEYTKYKNNINKVADSLKPIDYLSQNLNSQLIDSYQSKLFLANLSDSLKDIKQSLAKKINPPIDVQGEEKKLIQELKNVEIEINSLQQSINNLPYMAEEYIRIGEISNALNNILSSFNAKININKLNEKYKILEEKKEALLQLCDRTENARFENINLLNDCIQYYFEKFDKISDFKNCRVEFNLETMSLNLFSLSDVSSSNPILTGSQSNFMILHLCFFLGLHKYLLDKKSVFVPQILFIDQPSKPYFEREDDRAKLLDVFFLLNEFFNTLNKDKDETFQLILLEHAESHNWENHKMENFHLVDEFIGDNALVPKNLLKE